MSRFTTADTVRQDYKNLGPKYTTASTIASPVPPKPAEPPTLAVEVDHRRYVLAVIDEDGREAPHIAALLLAHFTRAEGKVKRWTIAPLKSEGGAR